MFKKYNRKAFTLIELLAVIIILGIIMLIAIPGVTGYITSSKKKTLLVTMQEYIDISNMEVNNGQYDFYDQNKIYAIPIECLPIEKGGKNPLGEWLQANDNYWAYVLVQYNSLTGDHTYGFTFKDSEGNGMYPIVEKQIAENTNQIKDNYNDLKKPITGKAIDFLPIEKWNNFAVDNDTTLIVLNALEEGQQGDGKTTCTLVQKGSNYEDVQNPGQGSEETIETKSFAEDSWNTIIKAVKAGKTENYHVGDTKQIDMGELGTHTVRIANMSTPSECSKEGFSQTACGFVIEFANIIALYNMNPHVEGNPFGTNKGGWPASAMRSYVNGTIYSALPSELQFGIINTYVVSSHGSDDSSNFTSIDKLYLLSTKEIWGTNDETDELSDDTRQLDYYKNLNVTQTNYSAAIKKYNNSTNAPWWLRAAYSGDNYKFFIVYYNGRNDYAGPFMPSGVSPSFRLG